MTNKIMEGYLEIDNETGTIWFKQAGIPILRITHLKTPIPDNMFIDLASVAAVTSYTPFPEDDSDKLDAPLAGRRCDTCGKEHQLHKRLNVPRASAFLYPGHEYIIVTQTDRQKYQRSWRMGFQGQGIDKHHAMFSARGPDRTHKGQYGGDVALDIREILEIHHVPRDDAKRHTGREIR